MTVVETPRRRSDQRATGRTAPERRVEAVVAAYIHELSPRHDAEREARAAVRIPVRGSLPGSPMVDLRSSLERDSTIDA